MSSRNAAAWALKPLSRPLVVGAAADPSPPPSGHVVIRVCDVAVNPIDWILQDTDLFGLSYVCEELSMASALRALINQCISPRFLAPMRQVKSSQSPTMSTTSMSVRG